MMGCRDAGKGQAAREAIMRATGSKQVALIGLDLSSMKRVAKFVENFRSTYDKVQNTSVFMHKDKNVFDTRLM